MQEFPIAEVMTSGPQPPIAPYEGGELNPTPEISPEVVEFKALVGEFRRVVMKFFESIPQQFRYISVSITPLTDEKYPDCSTRGTMAAHIEIPVLDEAKLPSFMYKSTSPLELGSTPLRSKSLVGLVFARTGQIYVGDPMKAQNKILEQATDLLMDQHKATAMMEQHMPVWTDMFRSDSMASSMVPPAWTGKLDQVRATIKKAFQKFSGWKTITVSRVSLMDGSDAEVFNPHCGIMIIHKDEPTGILDTEVGQLYMLDGGSRKVANVYLPEGKDFRQPIIFRRSDFIS